MQWSSSSSQRSLIFPLRFLRHKSACTSTCWRDVQDVQNQKKVELMWFLAMVFLVQWTSAIYSLVDVEFPNKMNRFFTQWMLRIACRSNSTAYSWMATNAAGELCMTSQGSSQNFRDLMFSWGLSVECWNRSTTHPKIRVKFAKTIQ